MAEEREPTLEELMAELDAETTMPDSTEDLKSEEDDDEEESPLRAALEKVKNRHGAGGALEQPAPPGKQLSSSPTSSGEDAKQIAPKEEPAKKEGAQVQA